MCAESTKNLIAFSYGDGEKQEERLRYNWVLFPEKSKSTVTLANGLQFQFRFPQHGDLRLKHEEMKQNYVQKFCGGSLSIGQLHEKAHNQAGSLTHSYNKIYTKFGKLGSGTYGSVFEVREASTAQLFAMKMLPDQKTLQYRKYRIAHAYLEQESRSGYSFSCKASSI